MRHARLAMFWFRRALRARSWHLTAYWLRGAVALRRLAYRSAERRSPRSSPPHFPSSQDNTRRWQCDESAQ
jgi:hypothetical protein